MLTDMLRTDKIEFYVSDDKSIILDVRPTSYDTLLTAFRMVQLSQSLVLFVRRQLELNCYLHFANTH